MNTYIIYRKELFIKAILYILVWAMLGVLSTYFLKSVTISIICLIIMIAPIFFIVAIKRKFTKKIIIQFGSNHFGITTSKSNGDEMQSEINLDEVKSYSIQIPNDKFKAIKFKLRDGESFEYSFFQKRQSDENISTDELIRSFLQVIKKYNETSAKDKVELYPSFYATNTGLFCIIGLSVMLVLGLYLASLSKAKALPIAFIFGFILIIQLIIKRKSELDYYKKIQGDIF